MAMDEGKGRATIWSDDERDAFWTFVRGRMAERKLQHNDVAGALNIDRAGLSRRLSGEVRAKPDARMVEQLVQVLKLDPAAADQLRRLAGQAVEMPPETRDTDGSDALVTSAARRRRLAARAVVPGAAGLALLALAVFQFSPGERVRPGGVWVSPADGEVARGPIRFAVRAYPTQRADPAVAAVEFTVSWPGRPGPWLVACRVASPSHDDLYECTWDPSAAGAPAGPLRVSFDVYDRASPANANLAPHGTRSIVYEPPGR